MIRNWIDENKEWLFADDAKSYCYRHHGLCKAHPALPARADRNDSALGGDVEGLRPLVLNCAGVSCLPWSAEGAGLRDASECETAHSAWISERKVRGGRNQEDLAFIECTPRYPIKKFKEYLADTHVCVWVKMGPELLGWPHKRMRVLGCAINRSSMLWLGPSSPEQVYKDISSRFFKSVQLSGEAFCLANPAQINDELLHFAKRQHNHLTLEALTHTDPMELLRMILPPGGVQRFHEWLSWGQSRGLSSLGGQYFFDCDHHAGQRGQSSGSFLPVNLRHGMVMKVEQFQPQSWRLLLGLEHLAMMGFHVFPQQLSEYFGESEVVAAMRGLTPGQVKKLVGNGMHLATQACWMMWVMAHTLPRSQFEKLPKSLLPRRAGSFDSWLAVSDSDDESL